MPGEGDGKAGRGEERRGRLKDLSQKVYLSALMYTTHLH